MSTPPSTPTHSIFDPPSVPTTRKRNLSVSFAALREDINEMPLVELTANALFGETGAVKKTRQRSPPPPASSLLSPLALHRQLPAFFFEPRPDSPPNSQNSSTGSYDIKMLENALKYIEDSIKEGDRKRAERYEMCERSPVGSQSSDQVTYSQNSQFSGEDPPDKFDVARVIVNMLSEERLQQLFRFGNVDDEKERVGRMINHMGADLKFFKEIVVETITVAKEAYSDALDFKNANP